MKLSIVSSLAVVLALAVTIGEPTPPPCSPDPLGGLDTGLHPDPAFRIGAGAAVLTGCNGNGPVLSPTQKGALKNIAADRIMCAAGMLGRPIDEIVAACGKTLMADDLKNLKDAIFGMKEGAAELGAKIPDAPAPGTYLAPPGASPR